MSADDLTTPPPSLSTLEPVVVIVLLIAFRRYLRVEDVYARG